jgi:hypothetical protein
VVPDGSDEQLESTALCAPALKLGDRERRKKLPLFAIARAKKR